MLKAQKYHLTLPTLRVSECVNAIHRVFDYDLSANDSIGIPKHKTKKEKTRKIEK